MESNYQQFDGANGYSMDQSPEASYQGYGRVSQAQNYEQPQGYEQQQSYEQPQGYGQQWGQEESGGCQGGMAAFGGAGYRSPLIRGKADREINSRNGLYSPSDRSRGAGGQGDYYNSLPGLGGSEGQMSYQGGDYQGGSNRSPYY